MRIKLETGPACDKHVSDNYLLAQIELTETDLTISVGPDCPESMLQVSKLWSHTVYELENLAVGMRTGGFPTATKYLRVTC